MDVIKKIGAALRTFFLDSNGKNVINVIERAMWTFVESFLLSMPCVESLGVDGYKWKCALFGAAFGVAPEFGRVPRGAQVDRVAVGEEDPQP